MHEGMFSYQIWNLHGQIRTCNFCQNFAQEGIPIIPSSGRKTSTHVVIIKKNPENPTYPCTNKNDDYLAKTIGAGYLFIPLFSMRLPVPLFYMYQEIFSTETSLKVIKKKVPQHLFALVKS